MPNELIFKSIGFTDHIYTDINRRTGPSHIFRERNSVNRIRMRELSNDSGSVGLSKTTAAIIREIVGYITVIRDKAMFDKNAWNSLLTSATDNGELVANFHLKYAAVCKSHSSKVVHDLVGKLDRNLCVVCSICGRSINFCAVSSRRPRVDMEANKGLCALINAALYAIKVIIAGIVAGLLARKNDLKAVSFKFILAGCHNLPGKVGFTLAISLRARINSAMAGIKCNYPNIASGALSVGRYAIRRISAFQRLLDRLSLNGIAITVCIVNRSALRIHGAIDNRKRIIPVRKVHYMFSVITLQNVGYRSQKVSIGVQRRAKYKSSRIIS